MEKETTIRSTAKWKKKKLFLFGLFTILVLLIIFEVVFRVIFYFQNRELHTSVYVQGSPLQTSDDTLVFKNQAFYLDYHKKYQNNELGMKSAPGDVYIPAKTENDFWVLLTGASAMEGMGSNRNGDWLEITGVDDHPYNETIAYYLQEMLQKSMPQKKVKVFNGAFSSSIICQSYLRYMQLANKLQPDWVISMDGQNDPATLDNESSLDYIKKEWSKNPQFHNPLQLIISITQHSAFINALKQKLFDIKQNARTYNAKHKDYPLRSQWASTAVPSVQIAATDDGIKRGIDNFSMWLLRYDSILNVRHQKHLLLLQPHMFLRDTTHLSNTELAVNHYYRATFQDIKQNAFLNEVYKRFSIADSLHKDIVPMLSVHHWMEPVFVDYCHFTNEATKKIATEIYSYIISGGKATIFKSNNN